MERIEFLGANGVGKTYLRRSVLALLNQRKIGWGNRAPIIGMRSAIRQIALEKMNRRGRIAALLARTSYGLLPPALAGSLAYRLASICCEDVDELPPPWPEFLEYVLRHDARDADDGKWRVRPCWAHASCSFNPQSACKERDEII